MGSATVVSASGGRNCRPRPASPLVSSRLLGNVVYPTYKNHGHTNILSLRIKSWKRIGFVQEIRITPNPHIRIDKAVRIQPKTTVRQGVGTEGLGISHFSLHNPLANVLVE